MPHVDQRTKAGLKAGKHMTAGRMNVTYRNSVGKSFQALVVGQGTSSGLKLVIRNSASANTPGNTIIDNVPMATTPKSLSAYISRNS
jgi:hypothetical protein